MAQNMEHAEPLLGESGEPWTNPHSNVSKGATRAAVLGCLDGLVSNLCLILGVMAPCLAGRMAESIFYLCLTKWNEWGGNRLRRKVGPF